MRTFSVLLAAALLLGNCAARPLAPPQVIVDQSACHRCHMLVSDLAFAASLRTDQGREETFDDVSCLLRATAGDSKPAAGIWVHDHQSDRWISAAEATFVVAPTIHAPMGGHVLAFADRASASRFALAENAQVVPSLQALRSMKGTY